MGGLRTGAKIRATDLSINFARYVGNDSSITIATGFTEASMPFALAISTDSLVTASGTNNTKFTLNKTGLWLITYQTRFHFLTAPTTGDGYAYLRLNGTTDIGGMTVPAPIYIHCLPGWQIIRPFNSGDWLESRVRNGTNQLLYCDNAEGYTSHISMTFLQAQGW